MRLEIQICLMQEKDIEFAIKIWVAQYDLHCSDSDFPVKWREDTTLLKRFLQSKIQRQQVFVATSEETVVGFLAYDKFMFHGEATIFCPAIGHGAIESLKERVYLELYRHASHLWIQHGTYNHMWTIFYQDQALKKVLFDVGYGSYLIDASIQSSSFKYQEPTSSISQATSEDKEVLYHLVKESNAYYASAPLFLKREDVSEDEILETIRSGGVYLYYQQGKAVGFISANLSEEDDFISLTTHESGSIDGLGAYIQPAYRHQNIGQELLQVAMNHLSLQKVEYIHVDFETANVLANKFWLKHFTPMLHSLKRNVPKDV